MERNGFCDCWRRLFMLYFYCTFIHFAPLRRCYLLILLTFLLQIIWIVAYSHIDTHCHLISWLQQTRKFSSLHFCFLSRKEKKKKITACSAFVLFPPRLLLVAFFPPLFIVVVRYFQWFGYLMCFGDCLYVRRVWHTPVSYASHDNSNAQARISCGFFGWSKVLIFSLRDICRAFGLLSASLPLSRSLSSIHTQRTYISHSPYSIFNITGICVYMRAAHS